MNLFRTPRTEHLGKPEFSSVYAPAEDSFLFLDALEKDWEVIENLKPTICLEIGCGSGIISTFVSQNLHSPCFVMCIDLNPASTAATAKTLKDNVIDKQAFWDTTTSDLAYSLLPVSRRHVDLILFNPPYVVTTSEEMLHGDATSKAWAGGKNGREVMDRFFTQATDLLSEQGIMYCVVIRENNLEDIQKLMKKHGFGTDVIAKRKCKNEELNILRFRQH